LILSDLFIAPYGEADAKVAYQLKILSVENRISIFTHNVTLYTNNVSLYKMPCVLWRLFYY